MLISISIKNLAVVESLQLDLSTGMTALTGETGAGKSILIDALGLALGDKADKNMIRSESSKADITAVFDLSDIPEATQWLEDYELFDGHECHLRRVITRDNRSRAFINGSPSPLKSLQSLGNLLVEIHGQHAHQRLLKNAFQLNSLDQYAKHTDLVAQTSHAFDEWRSAIEALQQLKTDEQDRISRLELLSFQFDELSQLNLQAGETAQLETDFKTLSNADRLIQESYEISNALYEDDNGMHSMISSLQNKLVQLAQLNPDLNDNVELLESTLINLQECSDALRHYADSLESDGSKLQEIEQRLQTIYEFSRKYRMEPEVLCEKAQQVETEIQTLQNADEQLKLLEQRAQQTHKAYLKLAGDLHQSRLTAAKQLKNNAIGLLKSLAMPEIKFKIDIQDLPEEKASRQGMDRVEFLVTTNPGQPLQPLRKVASGGELSRISLAIQVSTMSNMNVPTLIFDEVDVGIGGGTAEIVGRLLRKLGSNQQAICVTHLPQVAAQAHNHMKVAKQQTANHTTTFIEPLNKQERIHEIARMLGGVELTKQTLAHAREMIEKAAV